MTEQNPKSHQNKEGLNISELSRLTGVDRAALRRICVTVKPVRTVGAQKFYELADIQAVMSNKTSKSLKDEEAIERIRKYRIANDKAEGKLVLKTEVAAAIRRALGALASTIESRIVGEWPNVVSGLEPAQARIYARRLYDEVMLQCQALAKEFPE